MQNINEALWHKCNKPFLPARDIHGKHLGMGQIWRRKNDEGRWEYQQDPESLDDYYARQI